MEYFRKKEHTKDDKELKAYVDSAHEHIENVVRDNNILTLPPTPATVFYAGLTTGDLGETLKTLSAFGIPQMIDSMKTASDYPFVLWPEVKVMKKKTPDFIIKPAIQPISAHEGRPGHEMQFLAIQNSNYKSVIRHKLIQNTANVEGWALYAEKLIEEQVDAKDYETLMFYKSTYLLRIVRVITDYKISLGLMTPAEGIQYYMDTLGVARSTAESEIGRRLDMPGRDTGYFVGRLAIENLKQEMESSYPSTFTNHCFHDLLVGYSFAPAQFVKELIKTTDNCLTKE